MAYEVVSKKCENCDIVFTRFVSDKKASRFCSQKCSHNYQKGPNHPRWQSGPTVTSFQRKHQFWTPENWNDGQIDGKGYFRVYRPDYPRHYSEGYAKRYHIVWWLETNRIVPNGYALHHKDRNKLNDKFDNLELIEHGQHSREHNKTRVEAARIICYCRRCNKSFFLTRSRASDGKYGRGKYCSQKCYHAGPHKLFSEVYIERICPWCKNAFIVKRSSLKHRPGQFCSKGCGAKYRWANEVKTKGRIDQCACLSPEQQD